MSNFNGRIIHKHDIAENWEKATGFIPMQGEIIIYDIDANYDYERIKIGDGVTVVDELPFANDASDEIIVAKMDRENPTGTGSLSLNRKADTEIGFKSVAEGINATSSGYASHAEGWNTVASNNATHAEGNATTASAYTAHAEGSSTTASGYASHAEGEYTTASGQYSHVEGFNTIAASNYQHVQGQFNIEDSANKYLHIVGNGTAFNKRSNAHTIDGQGLGWFQGGIKVGGTGQDDTNAKELATKEYVDLQTSGIDAIFQKMDKNNPEGSGTFSLNRTANSPVGSCSVATGYNVIANGMAAHAEGYSTAAANVASHAEGRDTQANGIGSHAEGWTTDARGQWSHAEGNNTVAAGFSQHTQGKYNVEDSSSKYAHIVGNGNSVNDRSNAHTLDWNGLGWFKGGLKIGGTSQDDTDAKEIATTEYVNNAAAQKSQVQIITWGADD